MQGVGFHYHSWRSKNVQIWCRLLLTTFYFCKWNKDKILWVWELPGFCDSLKSPLSCIFCLLAIMLFCVGITQKSVLQLFFHPQTLWVKMAGISMGGLPECLWYILLTNILHSFIQKNPPCGIHMNKPHTFLCPLTFSCISLNVFFIILFPNTQNLNSLLRVNG